MDGRMGANINGPAIIRMPSWCREKLGEYHLYFSDHKGKYIRLRHIIIIKFPIFMIQKILILDNLRFYTIYTSNTP